MFIERVAFGPRTPLESEELRPPHNSWKSDYQCLSDLPEEAQLVRDRDGKLTSSLALRCALPAEPSGSPAASLSSLSFSVLIWG